jgi:glyoxylase-like metal-dependent hydrolase (beta-lactamase superfamily II)
MGKSIWLVQKKEYDFITSPEIQESYPNEYNAIKDISNLRKIDGDYDVFGDGTVVIKLMPGHTPGHSVLFLDLKSHGPLLLTGDLYHLYANRKNKRVPIFNYDVKQTLESMARFEEFAEKTGAKVYLQHQKEDFEKMPKAPNYLN